MSNAYVHVLQADARRILRDRFLLMIVTYLPVMAVAFHWAIPALTRAVQDQVDLVAYYPLICAGLVLILPYVLGCVLGLQLLEDKDENSLSAVMITPFSIHRYFFFRVALYAGVGCAMLIASHFAMGIVSIAPWQLVAVAVALSLNTPLSALIIAILAKNQVEGFAVMKGAGLLYTGPALSFLLPHGWDLLVGVIPFYWPIKAYYLAVSDGATALLWAAIAAAVVTQLIALVLLYRRFTRVVFRG